MLISPRDKARGESVGGRRGIFGEDEVVEVEVTGADERDDAKSFWDNLRQDVEVEEERQPRTPHNPGRPTTEEERRHMLH